MGFSEEEKKIIRKLRGRRRLRRIAVASLIALSITFVAVFLFLLSLRAQGQTFAGLFSRDADSQATSQATSSATPQQTSNPRPSRPSSQMEMPTLMPSDTEQASAVDRALAESLVQRERRDAERARLREVAPQPPQPSPATPGSDAVSLEPEEDPRP